MNQKQKMMDTRILYPNLLKEPLVVELLVQILDAKVLLGIFLLKTLHQPHIEGQDV